MNNNCQVKTLFALFLISCIMLMGCSTIKRIGGHARSAEQGKNQAVYRVVRVVDGDTIVINYGSKKEKLRLIGINTPETKHPTKGVEPYGREASAYVKNLLGNRDVKVKFDVQKRDRYGRLLGYVYLKDGTFVNARLVEEGYAQVMTIPPNVKYADHFKLLQRKARFTKKGLWGISK